MEEPKRHLTSTQFIRAMQLGRANDRNGVELSDMVEYERRGPIVAENAVFVISNVEVTEGISISAMLFNNKIILKNCKLNNLIIAHSIFNNELEFSNVQFSGGAYFNEVQFKSFSSYYCTYNYLTIDESKFSGAIELSHDTVNTSLSVINCENLSSLGIESLQIENHIYLTGSTINDLLIVDTTFQNFHMKYVPEKGTMRLTNIKFRQLTTLLGFTNLGYMQWNNLQLDQDSEIQITNAIMGRWDIVNCDFSKTEMIIYSSKITDAFYTNTKFPKRLKAPSEFVGKKKEHDILRDGYNQLKTIAQKQNDRGMFLDFQTEELHSFLMTLAPRKDWRTIFQLVAMRISNEYGANWVRGVIFVLLINLVFVSLAYSQRSFQLDTSGLSNYLIGYISSIFSLLTVPQKYFVSNWEVIWFYISRIFIAFGIYQTIAAFRKFGKSE